MAHLNKRRLAAAAGTAALIASVSACATSDTTTEGSGEATTIRVWWMEGAETAQYKSWMEVVEQFETDNPSVTVDFELKSFDQLQKSGQLILNSDEAPDLVEYPKGTATAGIVAQAGLLTNLSDVAAERGWLDNLQESLLAVGRYDSAGVMGTGDLYGVPSYAEYVSVIYNVDMLSERGLEPPTTIDEWESQMQVFVDEGVTPLALGAADYPIVHLIYQLALSQADQQWVRDYQFFESDVDFHDAAWTFAAQKTAEWVEQGYIGADATGIDGENAGAAFKGGTSPYFVSGSWWSGDFATNITGFEWSTFPFPGSGITQGSGGHIWVVPTASSEKDLAYDLIDRLLSTDAQNSMANHAGVAIAADPGAVTDPVGQLLAADMAAIVEADNLGLYPDWPVAGFYNIWLAESQNLVSGIQSPDGFLDALASAYESGKADLGQ